MRDNRPFLLQEDNLIKSLYEDQNIKKWSMIARLLTEQHNLPRNAKQCRDRYQQCLDPMMVSQWTPEEEAKLYKLHDEIGNKWAVIAQKFPGRTDNCVKNHFYSKLRKSLRHLNKVIKEKFKKEFKQLKIGAIYKIIEALEDRFNESTSIDQEGFNKCINLKKELLAYANKDQEELGKDHESQKQLIQQIVNFSRNYKRKTKKERRNSLNGSQLFKASIFEKRIKYSSDAQSSDSQYSFIVSHKEESENDSNESQIKLGVIEEDIRESLNSKYSNLPGAQKLDHEDDAIRNSLRGSYKGSCKDSFKEDLRGSYKGPFRQDLKGSYKQDLHSSYKSQNVNSHVEQVLRERGVLEEGNFFNNRPDQSICSLSLHSDSQKHDMFDDNLRISEGLRNIEEMQEQSPEENIFRSQR